MDQHKLVGPNFLAWRRNLRIVLQSEKIEFMLDQAPPVPPLPTATEQEREVYVKTIEPFSQAYCVMMESMSDDLQK